jgi:RecB family exonuclease
MIVRFGLSFDAGLPEIFETSIGRVTVGAAGLLSIFETQLGLVVPRESQAKRLVQYRSCLLQSDSPRRFYHQSFQTDPFGVSKTLLSWRDQWYMAGWDGSFVKGVGKRLRDMADVEQRACSEVAPCVGQRLQAVLKALGSRKTQIEKIELIEAISDYPQLWQRILSHFKTVALNIDGQGPSTSKKSDLGRLQSALWAINQKEGTKPQEIKLADDGSVVVLTARSREVSARFLAEYIKSKAGKWDAVILCGGRGKLLDQALASVDEARCGFFSTSNNRPPLQSLPLTLSVIWEPLDPYTLQQFLTHPVGPLPAKARRRLADALVKAPGVSGRPWQEALKKIEEHERKERGADEAKVQTLLAAIDFWVGCPRFDPDKGAPLFVIQERCAAVAAWLAKMRHVGEDSVTQALYAEAYAQALDLSEGLGSLASTGMKSMDRNTLGRLLDEVVGGGGLAGNPTELGHAAVTESHAGVVRPVDEVIWWDFSMPVLPSPYPWTQAERADLLRCNVDLQPPEARLIHAAKTWLRPVMAAGKRVVFVLHNSDAEHHPLWDQVKSCAKELPGFDVEEAIQSGRKLAGFPVKGLGLEFKPLPALKRWWSLSDGSLLGPRKEESFSSLDAFIKSPYQWVLKYKARLEAGRMAELPSGNLLNGSLVHRLIEDFFEEHPHWLKLRDTELGDWLERRMALLIEQEGAVLLGPGRAMEREAFQSTTRRAFSALIAGLKGAKAKTVEVESPGSCKFMQGELIGFIDLLLKDHSGRDIILDVKWGGGKYRENDLRQNRHFQLAVYAWMRKCMTRSAQFPSQAFFIVDDARFLAQDQATFPSATPCPNRDGETTADLWRRFEVTWKWRRKQLDRGLIEMTLGGAEPDEDSEAPEEGMQLEDHADQFNDFSVLTGWGEDA